MPAWPLVAVLCLGLAGVAWPFFGYGRALRLLAGSRRRPPAAPPPPGIAPGRVTVLLAVHNERSAVEARLRNLLDTDLAADRLRVVVASDGSTDGTDEVARAFPDPRVAVVRSEPRAGKSIAQNVGLAAIADGIVVITDCGTTFDRRTIPELVAPFDDPLVGVVDGALRFEPPPGAQAIRAHGAYWDYESRVRSAESELGILATASGAVMAARREAVGELPGHAGDDCVIPLMAVQAGLRVHRANAAQAWDESNSDPRAEFRSRVRMVVRNWQGTWMYPALLAPWRRPAVALGLWSHKLLRWCAPVSVLAALGASAALAFLEGGAWTWVAVAGWSSSALGGLDAFATWWTRGRHRATPLGSFALVCTAFGIGLAKAVSGHRIGGYRDRTAAVARALSLAGAAVAMVQGVQAGPPRIAGGWEAVSHIDLFPEGSIQPSFGLAVSADASVAFVGAGSGESYAGGGVAAVELATGRIVHPPLEVGRNCCALELVGGLVVGAWRGSRQVTAIDPAGWTLRSDLPLGFMPLGMATAPDRAWVVGSAGSKGAVSAFRAVGGTLEPAGSTELDAVPYRAVVSGGALVLAETSAAAVEWLDPAGLTRLGSHVVGGSPLAIAPWDGDRVLVATREGLLLDVSRREGIVSTVDLAALFSLDPSKCVQRDLDPSDIVVLPGRCVLVGAYRVDGFALSLAGDRPVALGRFPAGMRHRLGSADPAGATLLVARRRGLFSFGSHRTADRFEASPERRVVRANVVTAWAALSAGPPAFALASSDDASVRRCGARPVWTATPAAGIREVSALADDGPRGVIAVSRSDGGWSVDRVGGDGSWGTECALADARSPSWIGSWTGGSFVIDRLAHRGWVVEGTTALAVDSPRPRPRAAARLASGDWIVIHDTNPDIGCSLLRNGAWQRFEPLRAVGWPSAIAPAPGGASAYVVTFGGMLAEIGADLRVIRTRDLGVHGLSQVAVDAAGRIGCASENEGTALLLPSFGAVPVEFHVTGALGLVPLDTPDGGVAAVTLAGVDFLRPVPAR